MDDSANPYRSPVSAQPMAYEAPMRAAVVPASSGLRLLNLLIDYVAQMGLGIVVGALLVIVGGEAAIDALDSLPDRVGDIVIGLPILLVYYIVCESLFSRTLGKLLTGTKVVNEQGGKPSFGQILGRSFARLIPFEAFSFLGTPCRGWHDSLPKTYVVKANQLQPLPQPGTEQVMGRMP